MATPANRVPVRIARGSKANLDTAIAAGDLKEGEICYATDENGIYVVESGVLTQAGADLASTSIDALSDVDTTTAAPTDGQVLIWNNVDGEWQPGDRLSDVVSDTTPQLGGNLDVNGNYIVSASGGNVEIAPDTTGDLVVRGNDTDGSITLNCTANTHGVKIQSPPHSAAATYTLVLPDDTGTNGQALITDGSGGLSWAAPAADLSATSIDALSDVDTTTVAPTDGQALVWDNTNSVWEPGTVASGSVASLDDIGDVDTTTVPPTDGQALVWDNTAGQWEPGTVSGGGSVNALSDIGDVSPTGTEYVTTGSYTSTGSFPTSGQYRIFTGTDPDVLQIHVTDGLGGDQTAALAEIVNGSTFEASADGATGWITVTALSDATLASNVYDINISDADTTAIGGLGGTVYWRIKTSTTKADGDYLVWNAGDATWEPGTAVATVNGQSGAASLGVNDLDNFKGWLKYTVDDSGTSTPAAGTVSINFAGVDLFFSPTDAEGELYYTEYGTLVATDTMEIIFADNSSTTATINSTNNYAVNRIGINFTDNSFLTSLSNGDTVYVRFPGRFGGTAASDGQVLTWVAANSKWEAADAAVKSVNGGTGAVSLGIQDMNDYSEPTGYVFNTFQASSSPNEPGEYHFQQPGVANNLAFAKEDANGAATEVIKNLSIGSTVYLNGVAFTTDSAGGSFSGGGSVGSWYIGITEDLSSVSTSGLTVTLEPPLSDGDVLRYSSAGSAFKPAGASDLRSMLGIGEYADDTAAGTGGLASGEMYYNTTSSSYVLKT